MDTLPADLQALSNPAIVARAPATPELRLRFLKEAACSTGARGGLAAQSKVIRDRLTARTNELDRSYSFQALMLQDSLLPAVITEARDSVRQDDGNVIRYAGAIYRIVEPARLVTVAPTWRDYLFVGLETKAAVEMPHEAFLPKTDDEKQEWKKAVTGCWEKGVAQANSIFDMNLNRLTRDFSGMVRYRMLALRGMLAEPRVGVERQATAGTGNELVVDDQTYRISSDTRFHRDAGQWK